VEVAEADEGEREFTEKTRKEEGRAVAMRRRTPRRSRATGGDECQLADPCEASGSCWKCPGDADAEAWARAQIWPPFAHPRLGGAREWSKKTEGRSWPD
jgi:hypothetical protein